MYFYIVKTITIHKKKATRFLIDGYVIYHDEVRSIVDKHFGNDKLLWLRGAKGEATKKRDLYQFYINNKLINNHFKLYNFLKFEFCEALDLFSADEITSKTFTTQELQAAVDLPNFRMKQLLELTKT